MCLPILLTRAPSKGQVAAPVPTVTVPSVTVPTTGRAAPVPARSSNRFPVLEAVTCLLDLHKSQRVGDSQVSNRSGFAKTSLLR